MVDHPRPLLRRPWEAVEGTWELAVGGDEPAFDREVQVPFSPGTPASGVDVGGAVERVWYRRRLPAGGHNRLHLTVDRHATVWVDGRQVAAHEGGYTSFPVDVAGGSEVVVRADDDPLDLEAPRGKQDWQEPSHGIWYPRTIGIWRTPWLEHVPEVAIADLRWTGSFVRMELGLDARVEGPTPAGSRLRVRVRHRDRVLVDDTSLVQGPVVARTYAVGDGGFDDRVALGWWPRRPTLLDATVALVDADGVVLDQVESYTALRDVVVDEGRILLNGRPYPLRLVLDQGYWPETGATPPSVEALRRDIELTRALGFNGARKHQKTEDPRYLALADRLGLLVWAEMPSAYRFGALAAGRLLREWAEVVEAHRGHPSVIAWVPINESWGVQGCAEDRRQRALVEAMAATAAALDGTRPVSANDGWETVGGDIVGVHDYTQDADVLRSRYADVDAVVRSRSWNGELIDLDRRGPDGRAVVLSEFGGVALADDVAGGAWGYTTASSPDDLLRRYREQWRAVHDSPGLAGACWTQLTDTYQEVNGLLRADRTPKVPLDDVAAATRGR